MVPWERVDLLKDGLTDGARADDLNSVEFERDAMVDRRRVFEQKVLKKLYSSPPPEGKIPEALTTTFRAEKEQEKERSKSTGDSKGNAQIRPVNKKVYTVSLPPSGNEVCSTRLNEQHESQDSSEESEESICWQNDAEQYRHMDAWDSSISRRVRFQHVLL
ncbi:uncharacterized protein LOC132807484 isoform X4 [Hemiscyllium ocellatum]|uniref:uncharacterized protein LOC132807484 isoform X4 n=1 Tax=Hemiscyllium ocellatum TaxID=170820 RepID=UPI00296768C6|nr:uncharacterized protein LOC132807484 isoform X4 [Hemiscyllium ocellatum]